MNLSCKYYVQISIMMRDKGTFSDRSFPEEGIMLKRIIGQGNWSQVYEAYNLAKTEKYAVKVISDEKLTEPKINQLTNAEISILRQCNNPNVVKLYNSFSKERHVFMVLQFCNQGDLGDLLRANGTFSETIALHYLKQILNGFKGLHEVKAMHRDFKVENVMLHNNVCKIGDLGFGKQLFDQADVATTKLGSNMTMAPEVMRRMPYDFKADIWSIGVVYYQMLEGTYPFRGRNVDTILQKILLNQIAFQKPDTSEDSKDFIKKCLIVDPADRISWQQIYRHPLLTSSRIEPCMGTNKSEIDVNLNKRFYAQNQKKREFRPSEISDFAVQQRMFHRLSQKKSNIQKKQEINQYNNKEYEFKKNQQKLEKAEKKQENGGTTVTGILRQFQQQDQAKKQEKIPEKQIDNFFFYQEEKEKPFNKPAQRQLELQLQNLSYFRKENERKRLQNDPFPRRSEDKADIYQKHPYFQPEELRQPLPNAITQQDLEIFSQQYQIRQTATQIRDKYILKFNDYRFATLILYDRIKRIKTLFPAARHEFYLCLLLKDSYLKIRQILQSLERQVKIFDQSQYYPYFFYIYKKQIIQTFKLDSQNVIKPYFQEWKKKLKESYLSEEDQIELFNIQSTQHPSWNIYLSDKIKEYWSILVENLSNIKMGPETKKSLLIYVYSLESFQRHNRTHQFSFNKLQNDINNFNFAKAECKYLGLIRQGKQERKLQEPYPSLRFQGINSPLKVDYQRQPQVSNHYASRSPHSNPGVIRNRPMYPPEENQRSNPYYQSSSYHGFQTVNFPSYNYHPRGWILGRDPWRW